jgi:hypothetical protein
MMMDTGNRVSSATGPKRDKILGVITDHGIRYECLQVEARRPDDQSIFVMKGGPELYVYLQKTRNLTSATFPLVLNVRLTFLTQKVVRKGGAPDPLYFGRRTDRESQFVDDMMLWCSLNQKLGPKDYLFTRYQLAPKPGAKKDKRLLTPADITHVVKSAAVAFNLDPARFTTSSARRFLAAGGGLEDQEMKHRAGWAADSTVPQEHYLRNFESRGAFAVDSDSLTMEQVQRRLTQPLTECPEFDPDVETLAQQEQGAHGSGPSASSEETHTQELTQLAIDCGNTDDDNLVGLLASLTGPTSSPTNEVPIGQLAAMATSLVSPIGRGARGLKRGLPIYAHQKTAWSAGAKKSKP